MILNCDVYSHLRPHHRYGAKGEEVTVIRDDIDVLIVQNSVGDRFPVHKSKISFKSDDSTDTTSTPGADVHGMVQMPVRAISKARKPSKRASIPDASPNTLF